MSFIPGMFPAGVVRAAGGAGGFAARYVGQYVLDFASSDQATAIIPEEDLNYDLDGRQLMFLYGLEEPIFVFAVCVNEFETHTTFLPPINFDTGTFMFLSGGSQEGAGDIEFTVVADDVYDETAAVFVYEISGAAPLYEGFYGLNIPNALTEDMGRYCPAGGVTMGGAFNADEAQTFTWTNLTERLDVDTDVSRVSIADNGLTPEGAEVRSTVTITSPSGNVRGVMMSVAPEGQTGVRGGMMWGGGVSTIGSIIQIVGDPVINHAGAGDFTLLLCVGIESNNGNVTGVTYDGAAMTSRGSIANTGASPDLRLSMWSIPVTQASNPDGIVAITFAGSIAGTTCFAAFARLYGVGSFGTAVSSQGSGVGTSVAPNISAGGMLLGLHIRLTDTQAVTWSGLDEIADFDQGAYRISMAWRPQCAAETGRTINAVNASSDQFATLVLPINP